MTIRDDDTLVKMPTQIDPSAGTQVSKVWWDGEKLMAQPIPLEQLYREPEQPAQQEPVAKVVSTAPERIWLDLGFDPEVEDEVSFDDLFDATWSHDNATGNGIEYVRADLTRPPAREPEHKEELQRLRALVRAQQITIDKLEAREQEQPAQQEPVAYMGTDIDGNPNKFRLNPFSGSVPLYEKPQSVKVWDAEGYDALCQQLEGWKTKALKAEQPAQQEPVAGLSETQAKAILDLALDLEKTGRLVAITEGQERNDFVARNRNIQCALEDALRNATTPQPPAQGSIAVERWVWIFRDKQGEKYTSSGQLYTHDEAQESAKILGVEAVGPTGSAFICWELQFAKSKPLPKGGEA